MARLLKKLEDGRSLFAYDFETIEVKTSAENKELNDYEIEMIGSTAAMDRDGEVIEPDGFDLKNYKKNPVILPAHNYWEPAIARATNVKVIDGKLAFKIEFPEDGVNPLADVYRKLYKAGFMKASSVGFIPIEWVNGKGDKEPRRKYTKVELLELSLVSVPCNPQALLTGKGMNAAVEKGIISDDEKEAFLKAIEQDKEKNEINVFIEDAIKVQIDGVIKEFEDFKIKISESLKKDLADIVAMSMSKACQDIKDEIESKSHYSDILLGGAEPLKKDSQEHTPEKKKTNVNAVLKGIKQGFGG